MADKLTLQDIGLGTAPGGLGDGDDLRTGGGYINANNALIETAVNELASQSWEIDNTAETLALGEQVIAQVHAGITKTLPAAAALVTNNYNHILIANADTNSDVTIAPQAGEEIFFEGATLGAGTSHTLLPGFMALCIGRSSGDWNLFQIPIKELDVSDLGDVTITAVASGEVLKWDGSGWVNNTLEEADIVSRTTPAYGANPFLVHDSRSAAAASSTETIVLDEDPSVYIPIGGNNVTIKLDTDTVSPTARGLSSIRVSGKVFVQLNGAYTGLTVSGGTTTPTVTIGNGSPPSGATNDRGILAWEYFDDGTTDWLWYEWLSD